MFRGDYFYFRIECCVVIIVIMENIDFHDLFGPMNDFCVCFSSKTLQFIPVTCLKHVQYIVQCAGPVTPVMDRGKSYKIKRSLS
jgi:hypothetical protein